VLGAMLLSGLLAHCGSSTHATTGAAPGTDGGPSLHFGASDGAAGSFEAGTLPMTATVLGPGVTPSDPARIDGATPVADAAPRIDYPLAGAVMPRTVYPPNVMWTPQHAMPRAGDVYRVRMVRGASRIDGYFLDATGFTYSWQVPATAWPVVGSVDFADPIQLTVAVLSAGVVRESAPLSFRTVDAYLRGSVYYWSPPEERIKRIDVGTATVVDFLPNPGAPCIGCHALSRDGRTLATQQDDSHGRGISYTSFDLTRNLTANPAPTLLNTASAYGDESFSYRSDAKYLVLAGTGQNRKFFPLRVLGSVTGALVSTANTAMGIDPEWAPDGSAIAYTAKGTGGDDLMTASIGGTSFAASSLVHAGASGTDGTIDWHPTWSPDSKWIAFQNGAGSTAGGTGGVQQAGAIWLAARAGGGATRLGKLDGAAEDSYRPFFTPFDSGGYFWLLFTSMRTYGSATAGVSGQKQVWVAAIARSPSGGTDPSEVPYYLAGQETTNPIISPQWAPAPCKADGASCTTASDCCSGACSGSSGSMACGPPAQCAGRGGSCDTSADCCSPLSCGGHVCDAPLQ
jgi:hypothetical protein